jgi:hypothetical protein
VTFEARLVILSAGSFFSYGFFLAVSMLGERF